MNRQGVVVVMLGLAVLGCEPAKPVDRCGGVNCGPGRCVVLDEAPACLCDQGFVPVAGLTCAAPPPVDLCASNPCASLTNSLCQVNAGRASCVCPASRVEINGSCVVRTACVPNPCQNPRRTTCELTAGAASCRCDQGYAPEGEGCSALPVWSCAAQHADGDAAEPDECPMLARPLTIEVEETRSLMPAGDHDWFQIGVTPGHLFSFSAAAASLPLLIEVFDSTGVTLVASDNRGAAQAEVVFVAPAAQILTVRVRGVRASDTGAYAVSYRELGVDDYVNTTAGALTLVPGNPFAGVVQYAGDLDVVWLEVPALTAVQLRSDAGLQDLVIEVQRPDGGLRVLSGVEVSTLTTPTVERFSLTARGRNPRNVGDFSLALADLGPDDHSDDPIFGTPLATDDLAVGGRFERPGDVDSFSIQQSSGRIYRARWLGQNSSLQGTVVLGSGQVLGVGNYGVNALVWKADDSRPAAVRVQLGYSTAGTYTVAVEDLGFDDHSDDFTNATPLTGGIPAAGRLELPADIDTFSFTATAGRIFQATAAVVGNPGSVRVRITNATGVVMGEGDGSVGALIGATGTYRVQVLRGGYSVDLVRYTVVVTDQGLDDHGDTSGAATALTVGTPAPGSVQYASDIDAFAFTTLANHLYEVVCTRGQYTCSFQVKDPVGQVVASPGNSPSFLAATGGRFVVEVNGGSTYSPALGPYALAVNDLGLEDHGATPATATALTLGAPQSGRIGYAQDVDVFSFTAVAGHIYGASLGGSSLRLEVRNASSVLLGSAYGTVSLVAPSSGPLYVFVTNYSAASYSLVVTDRGVDDHSNTSAGATALTLGTAQVGDIQYQNDLDFFSLAVVAGHHHQVSCTASGGSCSVAVLDALGTVLATSYSGTSTSFKPAALTTTVFLRVSSGSESVRYSVVVTDLGADDHGDTRADATALTADAGVVSGVLETGSDLDAFTITAGAGDIVTVTCTTTAGTACSLLVSSPTGGNVAQTNTGTLVRTGFLATGPGDFLVQVRGSTYSTGAYTLSATRGTDDLTSTTALTLGTPRNGTIDYVGDTDVFSVQLTAGTSVQMSISSGSRVAVLSPTGGYVTNLYGGYTATVVPAVSGSYLLTVAADSYYGVIGSYTLLVQ